MIINGAAVAAAAASIVCFPVDHFDCHINWRICACAENAKRENDKKKR